MESNIDKSTLYVHEVDAHSRKLWERGFPFPILNLNDGFKYMGCTLKLNNYGKTDQDWLVTRIEKRVNL